MPDAVDMDISTYTEIHFQFLEQILSNNEETSLEFLVLFVERSVWPVIGRKRQTVRGQA